MLFAIVDATAIRLCLIFGCWLRRFHCEHVTAFCGVTIVVVVLLVWEFVACVFMKGSIAVAVFIVIFFEYCKLVDSGDLWCDISVSG